MIDYTTATATAVQSAIAGAGKARGWPVWNIQRPILSKGETNAKQAKGNQDRRLRPAIIYMTPARGADVKTDNGHVITACTHYGNCADVCLNKTGHGQRLGVKAARLGKAILALRFWDFYKLKLAAEVSRHVRLGHAAGVLPVLRANGTSDIPYVTKMYDEIYAAHDGQHGRPYLQGYEYTKNPAMIRAYLDGHIGRRTWPRNLHITYSRDEQKHSDAVAVETLNRGGTVSVVFRDYVPDTWQGFPCIDATADDWRWRQTPGTVAALVALGPEAKTDQSGFVVDNVWPRVFATPTTAPVRPQTAPVAAPLAFGHLSG